MVRKNVWRHQRGTINQKPQIEGHTIQLLKQEGQKEKQWDTKHNTEN